MREEKDVSQEVTWIAEGPTNQLFSFDSYVINGTVLTQNLLMIGGLIKIVALALWRVLCNSSILKIISLFTEIRLIIE